MSATERVHASRVRTRGTKQFFRTVLRRPVIIYVLFLAAIVVGPLVALEGRAFSGSGLVSLFNYRGIGEILFNTVALAVGSLVVALVLGVGLAVSVVHCPPSWQKVLGSIPLLPLVIPGVASTIGWIFLAAPRAGYLNALLRLLPWWSDLPSGPIDIYSILWIVLLTGFYYAGFVYLYVSSSMKTIGVELEAAARVSGAGGLRAFFTVTLPLMKPAIIYSSGLVVLMGLGQFTNPLLLGTPKNINVLTTVLFRTMSDYPIDYSLGAAVSAPLVVAGVLVMYFQRKAIGDESKYAVVTGKSNYRQIHGSKLASIPVLVFGLFAVVLPITALIMVSLSPFWTAHFSFSEITFAHIAQIVGDARIIEALRVTITAILLALVFVIPIGLIGALVLRGSIRSGPLTRRIVDLLTTLPMAMPAAIMGFAMLYSYTNPPFGLYGSLAIIVIAYVTLMITHSMRPQLSSLMSVGNEFTEASLVSGASRLRTFLSIELVLARKGISVAATVVIILLFHEFAASLMVSTGENRTIGALLYDYYTTGIYPQVAVVSLLMVVVAAVGVSIASLIGGRKALEL